MIFTQGKSISQKILFWAHLGAILAFGACASNSKTLQPLGLPSKNSTDTFAKTNVRSSRTAPLHASSVNKSGILSTFPLPSPTPGTSVISQTVATSPQNRTSSSQKQFRAALQPESVADFVREGILKSSSEDGIIFEKKPDAHASSGSRPLHPGQFQEAAILSKARADFARESLKTGRPAPTLSSQRGVFILEMPTGASARETAAAIDSLLARPGVNEVLLAPSPSFRP